MKLNFKKLLFPIFYIIAFFFAVVNVNAAEFIKCDHLTHIIVLNRTELSILNKTKSSIDANNKRYAIINNGPLIRDPCKYPECFLTQTDFAFQISPSFPVPPFSMSVNLTGQIYKSKSEARTWTLIAVIDKQTRIKEFFKVCQTAE